jgi:hypothetical protein
MMVTAAHSDNGRNQMKCIEKGKPTNKNKIRQHEKKPSSNIRYHFSLSFSSPFSPPPFPPLLRWWQRMPLPATPLTSTTTAVDVIPSMTMVRGEMDHDNHSCNDNNAHACEGLAVHPHHHCHHGGNPSWPS